jgi:hypothetical protein
MKVLDIKIDESIILPKSCDDMPDTLKIPLLATLTRACEKYDCKYEDLTWSIKGNPPVIKVKKRD